MEQGTVLSMVISMVLLLVVKKDLLVLLWVLEEVNADLKILMVERIVL